MLSYHDTVVGCRNAFYRLADMSHNHRLQCTRSAGWELWFLDVNNEGLKLGSEQGDEPFMISSGQLPMLTSRWTEPVYNRNEIKNLVNGISVAYETFECEFDEASGRLLVVFGDMEDAEDREIHMQHLMNHAGLFRSVYWSGYHWTANFISRTERTVVLQLRNPRTVKE